ncbi:uracil-DNA glycosylase [Candidatus Aerophobetes bacterium]|uniref:Uracil-DNA glycosylase n=1 Tax=Aerophobetes bacterium TaxID=2030807 RepID=A0A2A4X350_UNCAE|nr:MAG: uracil-DNA glycosylase [Candidatus Aerophobetes bacterium]
MVWKIEKSWHTVLKGELSKPYIRELKDFIDSQRKLESEVYPAENEVFSAFSHAPFNRVKVVIMGQDPYHGRNQAHGLSFSVKEGVKTPPSLKNIYKELEADVGVEIPGHGCLEKWSRQGVLLLNATLTVRKAEPKSHYNKGWERFTDAVCKQLLEQKEHLVFILWGKSAKEKITNIENFAKYSEKHCILTAAHPSPYSATAGFFGCQHFSQSNKYLAKWGQSLIDWRL